MAIATINQMVSRFDEAFRALPVDVPTVKVERLAMLVHDAMNAKTRAFHTAQHALGLCEGMKPVQVLAALFHDLVFCQLDGGIPAQLASLLEGVTRTENGALILQVPAPDDTANALCADIFGFCPGQVLPVHRGMNEFLSAVVAARLLQRHLGNAHLMAMIAHIELTIPFREPGANGGTAAEALAERVQAQSTKFQTALFFSAQEAATFARTVVADAVTLANRDIAGFTEASPAQCLSNTLLLIEESVPPGAALTIGALQEYRGGLLRMDDFLSRLDPAFICQSYDGHPDARTLVDRGATAKRNIAYSRDHLGVLLTSTAIIEALALTTGTDNPLAVFLGGGELAASNDLISSPLTAFVGRALAHRGTQDALQQARRMFDGDLSPRAFLKTLDHEVLGTLIRACAKTKPARDEALLALEQSLQADFDLASHGRHGTRDAR